MGRNPIIVVSDEDDDDWAPVAGSSTGVARVNQHANGSTSLGDLSMMARDDIKQKLSEIDAEIASVRAQLEPLQRLHTQLVAERRTLEGQLSASRTVKRNSKTLTKGTIDYQSSDWEWSNAITQTLRRIFHLSGFRLCQQGVINAAMDDRDIVCVMPTGGGKSLTYQLPAVMGGGLTVVISPLLALIWDQVRALKELGVECVMLTGATKKEEQNQIYKRIEQDAKGGSRELRLCYVTPEKVAKSKRFMSALEKASAKGRLNVGAYIKGDLSLSDEAHCCSQLGHDFRPDYKKLSVLKTLFPRVAIQAVTATLSSKTLPDLLKILQLKPICDGQAVNASGTVFFSAPLYRPNLHYKVLPKPSNGRAAIERIGSWIQQHHAGDSGIIYCLSKKDTETLADELDQWSGGAIKTGVYHAGIDDAEKERIHLNWRLGRVNCICATIAFGLGIDKGDVRYVIHHSMSKSLDGYYQETGRAGRDGRDSDCVLFYRGQDAARMSSLIYGDVDGTSKLHEMLRFAQDLKTCRKIAFAKYFATSSAVSTSAWDHPSAIGQTTDGSVTKCGMCDNCIRPSGATVTKNVTVETWRILRVLEEVEGAGGRVTLANLADLVRGLGGGTFGVTETNKKGKRKMAEEKEKLDLNAVAQGKVTLNKEDTETLLIQLTLDGYLRDSYHATAYAVNVYVTRGDRAVRLSRLTLDQVQSGSGPRIECTFPSRNRAADPSSSQTIKGVPKSSQVRLDSIDRKKPGSKSLVDLADLSDGGGDLIYDSDEEKPPRVQTKRARPSVKAPMQEEEDVDDGDYDDWIESGFAARDVGEVWSDPVEDCQKDGPWTLGQRGR